MIEKLGLSNDKGFQEIVPDAEKVNGLHLVRDENGVLKVGNIIIPQRKLLWSGELRVTSTAQDLTMEESLSYKTLEVSYRCGVSKGLRKEKFYVEEFGTNNFDYHIKAVEGTTGNLSYDGLSLSVIDTEEHRTIRVKNVSSSESRIYYLIAIYEVIE